MPDPPTFLFTDIVDSTQHWEADPAAMREALARHDVLLRTAIEGQGGSIFKTLGDAFCAIFDDPARAVAAALDAGRTLAAEDWPTPQPLRVRMALHRGPAERRDDDFFGPALNRTARLLAAGHGGQALLSAAVREAVDDLPGDAALHDLGTHRLKDLARPESVYQLDAPGLPTDFPPIHSLSTHPNNLPQPSTSFVGREAQLAAVQDLLAHHRLVTLTGAGGSGKTRLGLQAAAALLERFPDGVWVVELAPLSDPSLVAQSVARALGIAEEADKPLLQTFVDRVKEKQLLLFIDNCEHLLDTSAQLADTLLRACPGIRILASSREALGLFGERLFRVPALDSPDPRAAPDPTSLTRYEAVRLFVERASHGERAFAVTAQNASALVSVCRRLDGIPLAIELAAARVRALPIEELAERLDDRFRLLTGGADAALPRQQTLRSLIDWSWDLLGEAEKALLARLSVFVGGWTLEAAEAVVAGEGIEDWEVVDLLTRLVDKSLVQAEAETDTRFRMLETVRQYAHERLEATGDAALWRDQHLRHAVGFAAHAAPLLDGPEQSEWLERLETEHDNLRAALAWSRAAPERADDGLRLAGHLWWFWFVRGHLREGRAWLADLLAAAPEAGAARVGALNGAGVLALHQSEFDAADERFTEALTLCETLGDRAGMAAALGNLGLAAQWRGDFDTARAFHAQNLALRREMDDRAGVAAALGNLGIIATWQGDFDAARRLQEECLALRRALGDQQGISAAVSNLGMVLHELGLLEDALPLYEESLALQRSLGDRSGEAVSLGNLGLIAHAQERLDDARRLHEASLALQREVEERWGIGVTLGNLGAVAAAQGRFDDARAYFRECLALQQAFGDRRGLAVSLEGVAELAAREGRTGDAARLWGAAEALRETLGAPLAPGDQARYERQVATARAPNAAAFDDAWAEGRALDLEQAVASAL